MLTDSFHCVCFSVLFKRPFTCVVNSERGVSRLENLLGILGLRSRLVETLDGYSLDSGEMGYEAIGRVIEVERKKGYGYLKSCLKQPGKVRAPRKQIKQFYLFGCLPLGKKIIKGEVEIFKLFNIIPLMKVKNLPIWRRYYLGGFIPLLAIKSKGRK